VTHVRENILQPPYPLIVNDLSQCERDKAGEFLVLRLLH